jgi:ubiquinone/menaquinone biosynthesis C-methylase UbiE
MSTPYCDYEGSRYRDEFWGQGREYENAAERRALRALLPPGGRRLLEIGAGYGRLADLYTGYDEVYLLDYARTQMEQAQEYLAPGAGKERLRRNLAGFTYVVGDIYNLPFTDGFFETVVTVRVLHHIADIPTALAEVARVTAGGGVYVLEYANKRNLKAILRYWLGRQPSPFTLDPWEFVKLNYDFHPAYMEQQLTAAGFAIQEQRAASFFRIGLLKRVVPTRLLAGLDGLLQAPLARLKPAPSVFLRTLSQKPPAPEPAARWRCPHCHVPLEGSVSQYQTLDCPSCGARWNATGGIYDFKTPVGEPSAKTAGP